MQSDQLCSIGADMTSATSLSLSLYNLFLYGITGCFCLLLWPTLQTIVAYYYTQKYGELNNREALQINVLLYFALL